MKNNGKWFNKFTTEELFTEYIYSLMVKRKDFMVFINNKQILIEEEVDEWNKVNGLLDTTERLMYHYFVDGYAINYTGRATSILIPIDLIDKTYCEFVKQVEEDLK